MKPTRAFLGISHTPLMGLNPVGADVERKLKMALRAASDRVKEFDPELVVLVAPDHYNGFFNELMPPFCIGTEAQSVGDYDSPTGPLNVSSEVSVALADHLMEAGFDMAISRRMRVDHGFTQPLDLIWGGLSSPPLVPIFVNAVASPTVPRVRRCHELGESIGKFLDTQSSRVLLIGSGGLSHEPPVPTLSHPDPAVRERITTRREPTAADHEAKKQRVMAAGRAFASGDSSLKPLNPAWDNRWMDALEQGGVPLHALGALSERSITADAGVSGHESKNWLIARSALGMRSGFETKLRHYQAIPEYIAGFGLLMIQSRD